MTMLRGLGVAGVLIACAGSAAAIAGAESGRLAQQELRQAFPGVRLHEDGGRTRVIYGKPMTTARSPRLAAEGWLAQHGDAFGAGELELVERWAGEARMGDFHVFMYSQSIEGLPVDGSPGRILVRDNGDGTWSVVYAAGLFVAAPEGGFAPIGTTAQRALQFVKSSEFGRLPRWSQPSLVVYQLQTEEGPKAVRAWTFVGENPDKLRREKFTFFVDAATNAMLEARDEVHNIDVFGYVQGYATPGVAPDTASNPAALHPVNIIQVRITGGNNAYSGVDGFFNISHGGNSNVTIGADLNTGQWADVNDQSGTPILTATGTATPGQEAYLEFNPTPSELRTAQVNGFIHTGKIHDYITDRSSWTGMDFRCPVNVNLAQTCNAYFDGGSINFFRSGGGCPNSAYSTVVAHEYGHYIVARLGLAQGSFGEGYGDTCAEMLYDTGVIAQDFFGLGQPIRDNDNEIVTYPCGGEVHFCGQVLGGVWWHLRENMGATYGSGPGLEMTQQMHVDWSLITSGGSGNDGAHPGTAIEVLTIDDNDGNLDNGTPNYDEIFAAFDQHNIPVPEIRPILFSYPSGLPELLTPGQTNDVAVTIAANGVDPVPATAKLWYSVDGGGFASAALAHNGGDSYTATFPSLPCASNVEYHFQVQGDDSQLYEDPAIGEYAVQVFDSIDVVRDDDFEVAAGWSVGDTGDNATTGVWTRQDPLPTDAQPGDDVSDDGTQCWVTDGRGGNLGDYDVDNGKTTLKSPLIDLSGATDPVVSYWRWYSNDTGADPQNDIFRVEITNGGAWVRAETVGPAGQEASGDWYYHEFRVADFVTPSATVQLRFIAEDAGSGSLVEAAVDEFMVRDGVCADDCVADFNGDGTVNTQDVLAFLNAWNAGDGSADINGDGTINTQDVLAFLNLWNAGC
ncbi:MAG TPA: GC-type dockerin domain-anchored protein [Phycisphaerales bacterium]|nr:GC-type dockerin domain-anchored protein [Phycisphaerales bacterium]